MAINEKLIPRVYTYLGDRYTDVRWKGATCQAVMSGRKCIRGRNGGMLVEFSDGFRHVVLARLLRRKDKHTPHGKQRREI